MQIETAAAEDVGHYQIVTETKKSLDPQRARLTNQRRELRHLNRSQSRLRLENELLDTYRKLYQADKWDTFGMAFSIGFLASYFLFRWI